MAPRGQNRKSRSSVFFCSETKQTQAREIRKEALGQHSLTSVERPSYLRSDFVNVWRHARLVVYIYQRGELARKLVLFLPPLYLIKKCYSEEKLVAGLSQEFKGIKNAFRWLLESTMISKFRVQIKINSMALLFRLIIVQSTRQNLEQ